MTSSPADALADLVAQLLPSSPRLLRGVLGSRETTPSFNQTQEAAAGVFVLFPRAVYAVLGLGAKRLAAQADALLTQTRALQNQLPSLGRLVPPVEDVSPVSSVHSALQALSSAVASRTQGLSNIQKVPGYQQVTEATRQFLGSVRQTVVFQGELVDTPRATRNFLGVSVQGVLAALEDLKEGVKNLAGGLGDYNQVRLPQVVAAGIVSRASSLVGDLAKELQALSPEERLVKVQNAVLTLLAVQGVLTTFGSFQGAGDFYFLEGLGQPVSDGQHKGTAARVVGWDKTGTAAIVHGVNDTLVVTLEGQETHVVLPPSSPGVLEGSGRAALVGSTYGFVFGDGVTPVLGPGLSTPNNHQLVVAVGGEETVFELPLAGSAQGAVLRGSVDLGTLNYPGDVGNKTFVLKVGLGSTTSTTHFSTSTAFLNSPEDLLAQLSAQLVEDGVSVTASQGTSGELVLTETSSTGSSSRLEVLPSLYDVGSLLGLSPGVVAQGGAQPVTVDALVSALGPQLPEGLSAEAFFSPLKYSGLVDIPEGQGGAWMMPVGAADPVALNLQAGDLVVVEQGDNQGLFTVVSASPEGFLVSEPSVLQPGASVEVGPPTRGLRLRLNNPGAQLEARTTLEVRAPGSIAEEGARTLGFYPGVVVRAEPTPLVQLAPVLQLQLPRGVVTTERVSPPGLEDPGEVTTSLSDPFLLTWADDAVELPGEEYDEVEILAGPNKGFYQVAGPGSAPNQVRLRQLLPQTLALGQALTLSARYHQVALAIGSKVEGLESHVGLTGPGLPALLGVTEATAEGASPWFQLPAMPRGLQPGDVLELLDGDYQVPVVTAVLEAVETDTKRVRLDQALSRGSWAFGDSLPLPYGRLRVGKRQGYEILCEALGTWLGGPSALANYPARLNQAMNPLLTSERPSPLALGQAASVLDELTTGLEALGEALRAYAASTEPVPAVDALLTAFREKGSDRAIDLLVGAQFQAFFALTEDGASYAGAFQAAVRDVAREDLPVRRVNRPEAVQSQLVASAQSEDFEFSSSDLQEGAQPDPPGTFGEPAGYGRTLVHLGRVAGGIRPRGTPPPARGPPGRQPVIEPGGAPVDAKEGMAEEHGAKKQQGDDAQVPEGGVHGPRGCASGPAPRVNRARGERRGSPRGGPP